MNSINGYTIGCSGMRGWHDGPWVGEDAVGSSATNRGVLSRGIHSLLNLRSFGECLL